MGLDNVELHESLIEALPLEDASVDVVISNGVIDLVPDKDAVFDEIDRVLRPGGRLQLADVVIHHEVSEDARTAHRPLDRLNRRRVAPRASTRACWSQRAYTDITQGDLVDTYARSAFEDTRRKAAKFGAMGSTIRATKPARDRLSHLVAGAAVEHWLVGPRGGDPGRPGGTAPDEHDPPRALGRRARAPSPTARSESGEPSSGRTTVKVESVMAGPGSTQPPRPCARPRAWWPRRRRAGSRPGRRRRRCRPPRPEHG